MKQLLIFKSENHEKATLSRGMFAWGAMSLYTQTTNASLWERTTSQVDTFIYGSNDKNAILEGGTITVFDKAGLINSAFTINYLSEN